MLTQGIKSWLSKLFGWWPWKKTTEQEYAQSERPLNKGVTQESMLWSGSDGATPHSGVAPLILGQNESSQTSLSTIDEWPERVVQSSPPSPVPSPSPTIDKVDLPQPPTSQPPTSQPPQSIDSSESAVESGSANSELVIDPPPPPTPEQKLDFLHYLVKRGIVNEGFAEGQVPIQYKKNK
ncbi:MAG: hypothetical protein E6I91_19420 [Chloroflexi bacterium]|nr:MAG: hypothetical protein E6I91_19420 [Chloroflexota bacterium]